MILGPLIKTRRSRRRRMRRRRGNRKELGRREGRGGGESASRYTGTRAGSGPTLSRVIKPPSLSLPLTSFTHSCKNVIGWAWIRYLPGLINCAQRAASPPDHLGAGSPPLWSGGEKHPREGHWGPLSHPTMRKLKPQVNHSITLRYFVKQFSRINIL